MAASAIFGVAGYRDHAAHVDPNSGQNSTDAESMDKSLMARDALRDFARPNDLADPAARTGEKAASWCALAWPGANR